MKLKSYHAVWHYNGDSQANGWAEEVKALSKADVKNSIAEKYGVKPSDIIIADCWLLD